MKIFNSKVGKFLILAPIIFLILNSFYYMYASKEIHKALLMEKYDEAITAVDMLGAEIDSKPEHEWF